MLTEGWVTYLTGPFGIAFAFAAGFISFLSPCVLPLVPAYIAHLTGVTSDPDATATRRETLSHALAFVLGFGVVFTAIGASVGLVGSLVADQIPTLEKVAGVFLIVLGLNLMGVIKIPWLYRTYQIGSGTAGGGASPARATTGGGTVTMTATATTQSTALSYARSFGFGSSFAVAWTPCIGPVLGAILTLAAASSTVYQGAYLLLAYSAGLAVPFLAAGFAVGAISAGLRRYGRLLPVLEMVAGAVVVVVGVMIFLNEFTSLNQYFNLIPQLSSV
ncbi:MAG TPA: cytochrome c biogenesis protein CcdA [Dehalococcoidia bacterium]|nr:cytochrome c biogenesis protein CcdA [Dehalococcoidia bacterium]